jgi:methyltransferase (TIGR00027 family)
MLSSLTMTKRPMQTPSTLSTHYLSTADKAKLEARALLFSNYLSATELDQVGQRMLEHAKEWQLLIEQATEQMAAGTAPHAAAAQDLARRWATLFRASYSGNNDELDRKIRHAFTQEPGLSANIEIKLATFMQTALMHLHRLPSPQNIPDFDSPKPSAWTTAILRAAHQLLDAPLILNDPLALKILGPKQEAAMRADPSPYCNPFSNTLRATMVLRSRLAEDSWLCAKQRGVRQYVILGAGLDTLAYRDDTASNVIFEVDLPSTQRWKRNCLQAAGIAEPPSLRYVSSDFSHTTLGQALAAAGFQQDQAATFSWLGVSMYLATEDVIHTLHHIASHAPGSSIVFDYLVKPELLTPIERTGLEMMAAHLAAQGEELLSAFDPLALAQMLHQCGFQKIEHFSPETLSECYLSGRNDGLSLSRVFHMIRATI